MKTKNIPREKIPWFPAVDGDKCTGCGLCADFCPHGVYEKGAESPGVMVRNPFSCVVGCNNCENRCSERAITFPDLETISELIRRLRSES